MITVELIGGPLDGETGEYPETSETIMVRQPFIRTVPGLTIREHRIHHYRKTPDFFDGRQLFVHKAITVEKIV